MLYLYLYMYTCMWGCVILISLSLSIHVCMCAYLWHLAIIRLLTLYTKPNQRTWRSRSGT